MATNFKLVSLCAGAITLFAAGCDSGWDRVPEVAAQPTAQSQPPSGQLAANAGEAKAHPAESADDAALSAKVEMALDSEPDLHGAAIAVRSQEGVVTLSGTAKHPQLRSMAAQVALSIAGVELVRNEIALANEA